MSMGSPSAKTPRRAFRSDSASDGKTANKSTKDKKSSNSQCELNYDVLTIIFKKLNARDLRNAAQVCRCWSAVAEIEKRIRTEPPLTLAITFDDMKDCWTDLHTGEQLIDQLRMKPMVALTFANTGTVYDLERNENNADCPCESLPLSCPNIIMGNQKVVMDQLSWTKDDNQNVQKVASIFLPEARDVTVKTIYLMDLVDNEPWDMRERKKFPTIEDKVECIIFLTVYDNDFKPDLLEYIPRDRYESLCGGVADELIMCQRDKNGEVCATRMAWIGILISGPSVRSWTTVLSDRDNTKEKVELKLKLLKNRVELKKHSVAFIFSSLIDEEIFDVQSSIFKTVFPEVPLIGHLGGEEQYGDCSHDRMEERTDESAVIMILTYGSS